MEKFVKLNKKIKRALVVLTIIIVFLNLFLIIKNYFERQNEEVYYFNYQDTNYQMGYSSFCYKKGEDLYCEVKGKDVPVFWYSYFEK